MIDSVTVAQKKPIRLAIFDSHPIQYFSQIWRRLAAIPDLEPVVFYFSDHSIRGTIDPGFGVPVAWDVPLTEGYEHRFISRDADLFRFNSVSAPKVKQLLRDGQFDAVFLHGYMFRYCRQVVRAARLLGIGTVLPEIFATSFRSEGVARRRRWYVIFICDGFINTWTLIAAAAKRCASI